MRIYSTSGTTGTPSFIPLTAADLATWVRTSARSYAASGWRGASASSRPITLAPSSPGCARRLRPARPLPHSRWLRQYRAAHRRGRASETDGRRDYAVLRAASRRVGAETRHRSRQVEREAGDGGGGARRRRTGDALEARGGLGRERHRGDGHRRHFRVLWGECEEQAGMHFSGAASSILS